MPAILKMPHSIVRLKRHSQSSTPFGRHNLMAACAAFVRWSIAALIVFIIALPGIVSYNSSL